MTTPWYDLKTVIGLHHRGRRIETYHRYHQPFSFSILSTPSLLPYPFSLLLTLHDYYFLFSLLKIILLLYHSYSSYHSYGALFSTSNFSPHFLHTLIPPSILSSISDDDDDDCLLDFLDDDDGVDDNILLLLDILFLLYKRFNFFIYLLLYKRVSIHQIRANQFTAL